MKKHSLLVRFLKWRERNIGNRQFLMLLSILIGLFSGLAAVLIKNSVHLIQHLLEVGFRDSGLNFLFFLLPAIGFFLVFLFLYFVIKDKVRHGIPNVLYSLSKNNGKMDTHNMYSSIITSSFTVGFGGSVGLEGPTVATGAALGSNIGKLLRLNYKQVALMLSCASAASMAAIFKAPIAAIVFAVEVIMVDLTSFSLIPLLLASATGVLTSYLFLGKEVLYPFEVHVTYNLPDIPFYILLGVIAGLVSAYFTRLYVIIEKQFERIPTRFARFGVGAIALGILIFIFPSFYGEGYQSINAALQGQTHYLFERSMFYNFSDSFLATVFILVAVILLKVFATSATFGAGGVGGIFAPTLFIGANTGLLSALLINKTGIVNVPVENFALIGMAGLIAGVLHAPLTGIFLIAEITSGYELLLPLMVTSIFAYVTVMSFEPHSVYTVQLAKRKELVTHDKDKFVLRRMHVQELLETNFHSINPDATLGDLVRLIPQSRRNIFPVVDKYNNFYGIVKMDDIRNVMFWQELYDIKKVKDFMVVPPTTISSNDSMDAVAQKFQTSKVFNIPVVDDGKYIGFVSRANVFSSYREMLKHFSSD